MWRDGCPAKLLEVVAGNKRITALFPVVILVAEETPILGLSKLDWRAIVALLANADAGDQHVGGFLASDGLGVARLAVEADVRVVAKHRVWQPYCLDVGWSDFGQAAEAIAIVLRIRETMALLASFVP